ncbi:MAG: hypothetical protein LBD64_05610 [Odoribacteraceae bacterium]|nr:hypothetical protein [Odoribacteraceae bacterium]
MIRAIVKLFMVLFLCHVIPQPGKKGESKWNFFSRAIRECLVARAGKLASIPGGLPGVARERFSLPGMKRTRGAPA